MGKCEMCKVDYCNLKEHFKRMKHFCKICNKSYININIHLKGNKHKKSLKQKRLINRYKKGKDVLVCYPKQKKGRPCKLSKCIVKNHIIQREINARNRWKEYLILHPELN